MRIKKNQFKVFQDPNRFLLLICGRRWGKTTTVILKMFQKACESRGLYGYFAPTYKQAKLIAWEILKSTIPPHYILRINETELSVTLKNLSTIRLFGLDKADFIRGVKFKGIAIDEYDQTKPGVYENVLRPTISDSMGFAWFFGNPDSTKKKLRELHDQIKAEHREDWSVYHGLGFRSLDGGYIPPQEIESAKKELDPRTYREQYEASFEDLIGQVYYGFSPDHSVKEKDPDGFEVTYRPNLPLRLFWDFNVNPLCVGVGQFVSKRGEDGPLTDVHVVDELVLRNSNTPEMCRLILSKYENHKAGFIVYGDASGKARHTSSSLSDYQIIVDHFKNVPGFQLKVKNDNPPVKDRINAVNSKLLAYSGRRGLFLKPGLKMLPKDLMNVTYKEGTTELDKSDPERTHASDGLGYCIEYEFPVTKGFFR